MSAAPQQQQSAAAAAEAGSAAGPRQPAVGGAPRGRQFHLAPAQKAALRAAVLSALHHPDCEVDAGCLQAAVDEGLPEQAVRDAAAVACQRDANNGEARAREQQQGPAPSNKNPASPSTTPGAPAPSSSGPQWTMDAKTGSSKRRKTAPSDGIGLGNLPDEALAHVVGYLPRPSRALAAVALASYGHVSNPADIGDKYMSKVILGLTGAADRVMWDVLDFGEIERSLAAKISDADLQSVLVCIHAKENLKRLKITGCANITGAGLSPLTSSIILEQIDLSIAGERESPVLDPEPLISCEHVLPILDSIIAEEGNSLQHLQFPKCLRSKVGCLRPLDEFLNRCNDMFEQRGVDCEQCDQWVDDARLPSAPKGRNPWFPEDGEGGDHGVQSFTCYECMKNFCLDCYNDCECILQCKRCERKYCDECAVMHSCCGTSCDMRELRECGGTDDVSGRPCPVRFRFCNACFPYTGDIGSCDICSALICSECIEYHRCDNCSSSLCRDCLDHEDASRCYHCA